MDNLKNRVEIEYLFKKGLSGKEIFDVMVNVLGDSAPSYATVKRWVALFKHGRTDINDDPRSGGPKTATTSEIIDKINDLVLEDRRLTVVNLAEATGISTGSMHSILTSELGMRKLLTRWVPHSLNSDQKRIRVKLSQQHLGHFQKNRIDFVRRFVTMDETWIYHYDPELRQQTAEWTEPGCSGLKQPKLSKSSKKVMASVFWDEKEILLIDYLQTSKTIAGKYYSNLLDQLDTKIREKRRLQKKKIIFHQNNAPAHKGVLAMAKLKELHYELLEYPLYSPDLAPSDFHLFPNLKKFLRGKHFSSNEGVITAVEEYFGGLEGNHFRQGVNELENR